MVQFAAEGGWDFGFWILVVLYYLLRHNKVVAFRCRVLQRMAEQLRQACITRSHTQNQYHRDTQMETETETETETGRHTPLARR